MIGRFAPSPTGRMHLGNVWVALLNHLAIRSAGGTLLLRVEDLDRERCRPAYVEQMLADLAWLGLDYDRGAAADDGWRQSSRGAIYAGVFEQLQADGLVYPCYCRRADLHSASAPHPEDGHRVYPGLCRDRWPASRASREKITLASPESAVAIAAWRLLVPDQALTFNDCFCGPQTMNLARDWGDFVIRRGDGNFAYQLACAVDDALMGVSFILRGRDLLRSTFPQLYLFQLMGRPAPVYAHVPLLVDGQGYRLSKRQRSLDLGALQAAGYRAADLIGYLGWLAGLIDRREALTVRELLPHYHPDHLPQTDEITVAM